MKSLFNFKAFRRVVMLAILLPISSVAFAQGSDPAAISKLLRQAKTDAAIVHDETLREEAYSRSQLNWQMHAFCLTEIKHDANRLIADIQRLRVMREKGTRAQREAIDRIARRVQTMAVGLNTTIRTLNHSQGTVNMTPFRNRIHANRVLAEEIYGMICKSVNRNYEI